MPEQRLSDKLGGGFVGHAPALMAWDGDSEAEALTNLGDAIDCWLAAARANHRPIPQRDLELLTT